MLFYFVPNPTYLLSSWLACPFFVNEDLPFLLLRFILPKSVNYILNTQIDLHPCFLQKPKDLLSLIWIYASLPAVISLGFMPRVAPGYWLTVWWYHWGTPWRIFLISQPSFSYFSACKKYLPSVHRRAYFWVIKAVALDPENPLMNSTLWSSAAIYSLECSSVLGRR